MADKFWENAGTPVSDDDFWASAGSVEPIQPSAAPLTNDRSKDPWFPHATMFGADQNTMGYIAGTPFDSLKNFLNLIMSLPDAATQGFNKSMEFARNSPALLNNPAALVPLMVGQGLEDWGTRTVPNQPVEQTVNDVLQLPLQAAGMTPNPLLSLGANALSTVIDKGADAITRARNPSPNDPNIWGVLSDAASTFVSGYVGEGIGKAYRGARGMLPEGGSVSRADARTYLDQPLNQKALKLAENLKQLPKQNKADKIIEKGKIGRYDYEGLENISGMLEDVPEYVLSGLGLGDTATGVDVALPKRFEDKYEAIKASGLIQKAKTPKELRELASKSIEDVHDEMNAIRAETTKLEYGEKGSRQVDRSGGLSSIEQGDLKYPSSAGKSGMDTQPINDFLEAKLLEASEVGTDPMGQMKGAAIKATVQEIRDSMVRKGGRISTKDAINMYQALNNFRKRVGEFDTSTQSAVLKGEQSKNLMAAGGDTGASISTIAEFQEQLAGLIDKRLDELQYKGPKFTELNQKAEVGHILRDTGENAIRRLRTKRGGGKLEETSAQARQRDEAMGFASPDPRDASPGIARSMMRYGLELLGRRGPSDAMFKTRADLDRTRNMLPNVNTLMELGDAGWQLPPQTPGRALPDLPSLGAGGNMMRSAIQHGVMQQQEPAPDQPFPRDTQFLKQNLGLLVDKLASLGVPDAMADDAANLLSSDNPEMQAQGMAELSKAVPGLFAPSSYSSEMDGRIMDPAERGIHAQQLRIQRDTGQLDRLQWAKQYSNLNRDGSLGARPTVNPNPNQTPNTVVSGYEMTPMGRTREYSY